MAAKAVKQVQPNQAEADVDKVFFPNESIRVGVKLRNYGKTDPGSIWRVTHIETYVRLPSGLYRLDRTPEIIRLNDIVHIQRESTDPAMVNKRNPSFGSLKYSAIWRLV